VLCPLSYEPWTGETNESVRKDSNLHPPPPWRGALPLLRPTLAPTSPPRPRERRPRLSAVEHGPSGHSSLENHGCSELRLCILIARWVHLIAGIMWIGNSMLFNWLDRNLERPRTTKPGLVGNIWMVHSGGFYEVEKKALAPSQMPQTLHWFKWQNGITWLSGISLLILVFYMAAASTMVDPEVADITQPGGPDQRRLAADRLPRLRPHLAHARSASAPASPPSTIAVVIARLRRLLQLLQRPRRLRARRRADRHPDDRQRVVRDPALAARADRRHRKRAASRTPRSATRPSSGRSTTTTSPSRCCSSCSAATSPRPSATRRAGSS
jgi:hypothetical protein